MASSWKETNAKEEEERGNVPRTTFSRETILTITMISERDDYTLDRFIAVKVFHWRESRSL